MPTASGRVMFDAATDVGSARDVPREAYRRSRADLRTRKEQNLKRRAEHLALHEEKTRVIATWVAEHVMEHLRVVTGRSNIAVSADGCAGASTAHLG